MSDSKQLLILGNGFDLHCGLKSSYKDFFRSEILYAANGLKLLQPGVSGFWESLLLEYYKIKKNDDYNWCDIETIIKKTLWQLFVKSDLAKSSLWHYVLEISKIKIVLNNSNTSFASIEDYILMHCRNFIYNYKYRNMSDDDLTNLLIQNLCQELHGFEKRFCRYLKNQIEKSNNKNNQYEEYIIKAVNLIAYITGFSNTKYENIDNIIHQEEKAFEKSITPTQKTVTWKNINVLSNDFIKLKTTNILNFNYTALFDLLEVESPCCYNNVHGKLCSKHCTEDCNTSNIIFGIDDRVTQSHDTNSVLRLFSKTYRKMSDTSSPTNILPANDGTPIVIKFYGHSLSEADYSYFQSIFDYYNLYGNSNISLMFYYSKGFEQNDAIYKLINAYGQTLSNQDQGKNLIHKLLLENRLKIVEIP